MSTPENPDYAQARAKAQAEALAEVNRILHSPREPKILFSYPKFRERLDILLFGERWGSFSVADQYCYKSIGTTLGGATITAILAFSGMRENFWAVVPGIAGIALGTYYGYRRKQATEN